MITNTVKSEEAKRQASDSEGEGPSPETVPIPSTQSSGVVIPRRASLTGKIGVAINEERRNAFEKRLLGICLAVLSGNDKVLINNIIDTTGDIILAEPDLKELIALITGSDNIQIITGDRFVKIGCIRGKLPIWVPVIKIVVNDQDFYVAYNRIHTMFAEYRITLEKVVA